MGTVKSVFITEHEDTAWLLCWGDKKIKQTNVCFIYIYFISVLCLSFFIGVLCLSFFYAVIKPSKQKYLFIVFYAVIKPSKQKYLFIVFL